MTRIDHAAEAEALRTIASVTPSVSEAQSLLAAAQVHATLALVEQQRIANLIALVDWIVVDEAVFDREPKTSYGGLGNVKGLRPDIAAALGLSS